MFLPLQQLLALPGTITEPLALAEELITAYGRYRYALPLLFHSCAERKRSASQYVLMKIIKGTEEETMAYIQGSCY
jgi:hypothetical protein